MPDVTEPPQRLGVSYIHGDMSTKEVILINIGQKIELSMYQTRCGERLRNRLGVAALLSLFPHTKSDSPERRQGEIDRAVHSYS